MPDVQNHFEGWAVVELFGHGKAIGFVTTEYYGTSCLFRVDTPERAEREYTLEKPTWGEDPETMCSRLIPKGSKVKRAAAPGHSRLLGPGSIFAINPCTEDVAKMQLEIGEPRPLIVVEMPKGATAPMLPGEPDEEGDIPEDEEESIA